MNSLEIPLIIESLQELDSDSITVEECLNLICQTLTDRLNNFNAVGNIHNYAQISFEYLDVIRLYYSNLSNNEFCETKYKEIVFTKDSEPEEMDCGVFRACSILCTMIKNRDYDKKVTIAATRLQEHIKLLNLYSTDNYTE
jgi:hypothetical protein